MILEEACYSLKLECALRDLGFVDIGWKCVAHAGIFVYLMIQMEIGFSLIYLITICVEFV